MEDQVCNHLSAIKTLKHAKDYVCGECIKTNDNWMHLRTCQECGVTLCCDSSPNRHASKHAHATGHPVVISPNPANAGYGATLMNRWRNTDVAAGIVIQRIQYTFSSR